jgi:hypothetical protein
VPANTIVRARNGPRRRRNRNIANRQHVMGLPKGISAAGVGFLKCAFAPPDFGVDPGTGIPDSFQGKVLTIKDGRTITLNCPKGQNTWIMVAPTPGFSHFTATTNTGQVPSTWEGQAWANYESAFGPNGYNSTNNYEKYRYASQATELVCTNSALTASGSISAYRIPLQFGVEGNYFLYSLDPNPLFDIASQNTVMGLSAINTMIPKESYTGHVLKGFYNYNYDESNNFTWQNFYSAQNYSSHPAAEHAGGQILMKPTDDNLRLLGIGNLNSTIIRVTAGSEDISLIVKTWYCLEVLPKPNSNVYQFSHESPALDPVALELYHKAKTRLPVGVPRSENSNFWNRTLSVFRGIVGFMSRIPGPTGLIAGGVNMLSEGIGALFI